MVKQRQKYKEIHTRANRKKRRVQTNNNFKIREDMSQILKYVSLKGNNKRIKIALIEKDGQFIFVQETRTLIDRKTRQIVGTDNIYSVETFAVLNDVFSKFLEDPEIKNKILHRELSKIVKFTGTSNF